MQKIIVLFTDSYKEFRSVKTVTTLAMLAALAVILRYYSIEYGQFIRIGFSDIPSGLSAYLFGPAVGGIFCGAVDILKYILKPSGPFCLQLTLVKILAGMVYGCFYYRRRLTVRRILATQFTVKLLCNVVLNTLCLSVLYGQALRVILPARAISNLVMWPIDTIVFFAVAKIMERFHL